MHHNCFNLFLFLMDLILSIISKILSFINIFSIDSSNNLISKDILDFFFYFFSRTFSQSLLRFIFRIIYLSIVNWIYYLFICYQWVLLFIYLLLIGPIIYMSFLLFFITFREHMAAALQSMDLLLIFLIIQKYPQKVITVITTVVLIRNLSEAYSVG